MGFHISVQILLGAGILACIVLLVHLILMVRLVAKVQLSVAYRSDSSTREWRSLFEKLKRQASEAEETAASIIAKTRRT